MLKKNVYLLFPAGYSGNYVNWAISISDDSLKNTTVLNPINITNSNKFGGQGTSHLHQRIPTHMAIADHMVWVAYNRPTENNIYVIFTETDSISMTIGSICRYEKDPVFIIIHDDGDTDTRTYGNLNALTKWPTYMHTIQKMYNFRIKNREPERRESNNEQVETDYDFFNAGSDINIRNAIASGEFKWPIALDPLNKNTKEKYSLEIKRSKLWYETRSALQPHELPKSVHLIRDELPLGSIFQLSCRDVADVHFPDILENILEKSGCSDNFNTSHVREIHQNYIDSQQNLKWFSSIQQWRETGVLDPYLTSNYCIEGFVIREILKEIGYSKYTIAQHKLWSTFYNNVADQSWPQCEHEYEYLGLPERIQNELLNKFNYKVNESLIIMKEFANWRTLSLNDINNMYISHRLLNKRPRPTDFVITK